jgi:hypothetical protein
MFYVGPIMHQYIFRIERKVENKIQTSWSGRRKINDTMYAITDFRFSYFDSHFEG